MVFPVSGPRGPRPSEIIGPSPPEVRCVPVPAPNSGINAVDGLLTMGERGPEDSIFQYNLIPSQYGCRVRTGYSDWATGVGTAVKTIFPYEGSTDATDRLWAMAPTGIYNVTASVASPAINTAFPTVDATSGYGQWTNYTTIGGHFGIYCDESNGYYVYDESAGTWAKVAMGGGATQVSGVDPALFVQPLIFKSRLWFVEKGSARAWYLGAGLIFGPAVAFNFGNKFQRGGNIASITAWTVDGGDGSDDILVVISTGGDVILYKGNDPGSTPPDFNQIGQWYIGPPPIGRRFAYPLGGEMYILTTYGIVPLSSLISGVLIQQDESTLSRKITPLVNQQMLQARLFYGWELKLLSSENLFMASVPRQIGFPDIQFVQSTNTKGWAVYRDIPYFTGATQNGSFYIGTLDGRVLLHFGSQDAVDINGLNGVAITWSALSVFQEYGVVGQYKITQFIRPVFLAAATPAYAVEARYDYNLSEVLSQPSLPSFSGSLWDVGLWDFALWGGTYLEIENPVGGTGIGRNIAVAINGSSSAPTILIRYDLMFTTGGLL